MLLGVFIDGRGEVGGVVFEEERIGLYYLQHFAAQLVLFLPGNLSGSHELERRSLVSS